MYKGYSYFQIRFQFQIYKLPLNLLSSFYKLLEKIIVEQIFKYLNKYKLL